MVVDGKEKDKGAAEVVAAGCPKVIPVACGCAAAGWPKEIPVDCVCAAGVEKDRGCTVFVGAVVCGAPNRGVV